jgi:type VI protein secretion system component Hcp
MKRKVLVTVLVCLALAVVTDTAFGALNAYLKIKGVEGESSKGGHEKWIIIESFGSKPPVLPTAAQGKGGPGRFAIKHTANIDVSLAMVRLMLSNQPFEMALDVMEGGTLVHYLIEGCTIAAYSVNRSTSTKASSDYPPLEEISFIYHTIQRAK